MAHIGKKNDNRQLLKVNDIQEPCDDNIKKLMKLLNEGVIVVWRNHDGRRKQITIDTGGG